MPLLGHDDAYPRTMVVRDDAEGAGYRSQSPRTRGGPTDRRTGDPRCGFRDGVSGHMARGCARAFRNAARAIHATRDAASRSSWANGAIGMPVRRCPRICKDE